MRTRTTARWFDLRLSAWPAIVVAAACMSPEAGRTADSTVPDGQLLRVSAHPGGVRAIVFLPGGKQILSGGGAYRAGMPVGCELCLWDVALGKVVRRFGGHTGPVLAAAVSPDGNCLISGSADCTAQLWDTTTGKELVRFRHQAAVRTTAFAPDGQSVLTGSADGTVRRWETATGQLLQVYDRERARDINAAVFSPDGRHVVTGGETGTIHVWDADTARIEAACNVGASVLGLAAAPDGRGILSADNRGDVWLWPIRGGDPVRGFSRATRATPSLAVSADGKYVAVGRSDGTVRICVIASGKEWTRFSGHAGAVTGVAFAPDGRKLVSAGEDSTIQLWQLPD